MRKILVAEVVWNKVAFEYKIPPLKFYGIWLAKRPNAPGSEDSEADVWVCWNSSPSPVKSSVSMRLSSSREVSGKPSILFSRDSRPVTEGGWLVTYDDESSAADRTMSFSILTSCSSFCERHKLSLLEEHKNEETWEGGVGDKLHLEYRGTGRVEHAKTEEIEYGPLWGRV